jgi:glycerophosphoryl diester phosphodiesterase
MTKNPEQAPVTVRPLVLAHRGSTGNRGRDAEMSAAPTSPGGGSSPGLPVRENTLAAFSRARDLGADGVELDVRLSADGHLVVHHDPSIEGGGPVHELTRAELPAHVPGLDEVLEACRGLLVNIEIKNLPGEASFDPDERTAHLVMDLLAGRIGDDIVISSFWPGSLSAVRARDAGVATGLLLASWANPEGALAMARDVGATAVHPHFSLVEARWVAEAHRKGFKVNVWTVNEPDDVVAAGKVGVDAVITDDVPGAREALGL